VSCHEPVLEGAFADLSLVNDATILLRDMAGDAATNAASRVKPSSDDLAQIDHPATDNTWHDTPDLSKDTLKNRLQTVYKGDPKEDVQAAAAQGVSAAHPTGSSDPNALAETAATEQRTGATMGIDSQGGVATAANTLQQRANVNLDAETQEKAKSKAQELRARTKEYLSKKMPQERRDQTVWRLKVRHFLPRDEL
jgi:hypothetical protein